MKSGRKILQCTPKNDPDWIKELSLHLDSGKQYKLTDEDKKFLRDLFLEYKIDGMKPKEALEKAKNVLMSFKNNKKMRIKRTNQAISEIIGTMLLLGISVSLFSVIYISVLTVPYSPPTPSVNIICQIDDGNITLSHYGGKALNFDSKIMLTVDGQPVDPILAGDYLYNDSNGDGLWNMGEKVVFSYASLVSGGEQIEVNILDIGSNSLVMTGIMEVPK